MIKRYMKLALVFTIVVLLFGCAVSSKYMRDVADSGISYMPGANEAVVVFMYKTWQISVYGNWRKC